MGASAVLTKPAPKHVTTVRAETVTINFTTRDCAQIKVNIQIDGDLKQSSEHPTLELPTAVMAALHQFFD